MKDGVPAPLTATGSPTMPDGLRALADWLDAYDVIRGDTRSTQVQDDLRRWADDVESMVALLARYHTALDTLEKVATLDLPHDLRMRVYHDLNAAGRL